MKVASRPSRTAISFTAALSMNARSAASSASECLTLISYWEFMNSWFAANASSPRSSHAEQHLEHDLARIGDGADRVDAGELVDVAAQAVLRGGSRSARKNSSSGATIGVSPRAAYSSTTRREQRPRARRPVLGAVERPGLAEAPRHLRLPRHGAQRVEVGLDREVDVAHLAPDDRRVPEVRAHHGRAEGDAFVAHAAEVTDRDVLAAGDAVQVGVEQPNRADAEPAHRPDGCLGLVVVTQLRASLSCQERTCTGRRLMPLKKFERRRVGGPASSMRSR